MTRMAVVDASVVGPWLFEDEQHPLSEHILDELEAGVLTLLAPALWRLEIANALAMAERRGRIDPDGADQALEQLERLAVEIDPAPPNPSHLLALCRRHQRTAYDALYLDLAQRRDLPLATLDGGMRQACREAGGTLFSGR